MPPARRKYAKVPKKRKSTTRRNSLTPGKRRLFAAITVALPFLALAIAELVLRLFGWGGYPDWIRPAGILPSGKTLCIVEPAAAKPYFYANPDRPGYAEQSSFLMPKPEDTFRIFIVGESAAKGYPQPRNLAVSSFLEAMLSDATKDKKVEVINLGTTAVASFPLVYQLRDALRYDPDLFVFYVGNNEFFGAYGVASINASGSLPVWALRLMRAVRGLALVQVLDGWLYKGADENRSLMEQMIGRTFIPADSPLRDAAARNLGANLGTMIEDAKRADIPVIVCTTASNESGLAPLGKDDMSGLEKSRQNEVRSLVAQAESSIAANNPALASDLLGRAEDLAPSHARARFLSGLAMAAMGRTKEAREDFLAARDLDTMPWRPTSLTEEAIRTAARTRGAPLCDIATIFREESRRGATGWELLDDHVHLSLAGQARAARAMAGAVAPMLGIAPAALAALPDDRAYALRLGSNFYDGYRVDHTLRVLFGIPFMKETNPEAFHRFDQAARDAESKMSPAVLAAAREWQTFRPHAGGLRPLTGMVARIMLRENRPAEALPLYELAANQVPDYTSWHLEYVYFALACRQKINGTLDGNDRAAAINAIAEGKFLLDHGYSESGLTERYVGRLHQLRGEWSEAIPFLLAARPKMKAEDLVATDQALFVSYLHTGKKAEAISLAEKGMKESGRFSAVYRQMLDQARR